MIKNPTNPINPKVLSKSAKVFCDICYRNLTAHGTLFELFLCKNNEKGQETRVIHICSTCRRFEIESLFDFTNQEDNTRCAYCEMSQKHMKNEINIHINKYRSKRLSSSDKIDNPFSQYPNPKKFKLCEQCYILLIEGKILREKSYEYHGFIPYFNK